MKSDPLTHNNDWLFYSNTQEYHLNYMALTRLLHGRAGVEPCRFLMFPTNA